MINYSNFYSMLVIWNLLLWMVTQVLCQNLRKIFFFVLNCRYFSIFWLLKHDNAYVICFYCNPFYRFFHLLDNSIWCIKYFNFSDFNLSFLLLLLIIFWYLYNPMLNSWSRIFIPVFSPKSFTSIVLTIRILIHLS